jgi:3-polyprenyl-4-hydroxybenzoate decarboxylase
MMFPVLKKVYVVDSDVNIEAVMSVCWRCRLSFSDVVNVVAALYSPFETC